MQLRPYQSELIQLTAQKLARSMRVILCAPTGAGKTVMFSTIIERYLAKSMFNRVLIVTDRVQLFGQTFKAVDQLNIKPQLFNADTKKTDVINGRCVVGMIETIKRRNLNNLGQFGLIIIDEAHKGTFKKIFDLFPNSLVIGATATPLSSSKKNPLKNYYNDIAFSVDTPHLIQDGYLCPAKTYTMRQADLSELKKQNGKYTEASQSEVFGTARVFEGMLDAYKQHGIGRKTMVFCSSVKATESRYNQFKEKGIEAYRVHSKMNKADYLHNLEKFHQSDHGVMLNCGILTTGYDHPPISCIILDRAITSLPLYLQICGRGSRLSPKTNKSKFIIIDMGGNVDRLGLWEQPRNWEDWFHNPPKPSQAKPAPVKNCPKCEAIIYASATNCPYCKHKFIPKIKDPISGQLVEVPSLLDPIKRKRINELTVHELIQLQQIKEYKNGFILRVLRTKPDAEEQIKLFAKLKGYKPAWAYRQIQGAKNYTNFIVS